MKHAMGDTKFCCIYVDQQKWSCMSNYIRVITRQNGTSGVIIVQNCLCHHNALAMCHYSAIIIIVCHYNVVIVFVMN